MTVSYEVAGQKRPVTCPKLPRFPAHPAAAKKSEGERVNVEDLIIKIDVTTGDVSLVTDLGDIFPDLKANAKVAQDGDLDWIHINTIQWLGGGTVLLSSRETSTVIKLTDIYGMPTVD